MSAKKQKPAAPVPAGDLSVEDRVELAMKALASHYANTIPDGAEWMLQTCRVIIEKTLSDCRALDNYLVEDGYEPFYIPLLTLESPPAVQSVHALACRELKNVFGNSKPRYKLQREGRREEAADKLHIHRFRETLRDGWPVADALRIHTESIAERNEAGRVEHLAALVATIAEFQRKPERFTRNLTEWILRAWLPLCLWECPADSKEAHGRMKNAASLINRTPPAELDFATAWKNVRSRHMSAVQPPS